MLRLSVLFLATACVSCSSAEIKESESNLDVNVANIANVSATPMDSSDFAQLKRFAESYEPRFRREVIPSPPELTPQLSEIILNASKTNSRAHEPYVLLIFVKLYRFHLEHFEQGYELGRNNSLTKEFYRLIGEKNFERAERMGSHLAEKYVRKNPNLLQYAPIKAELQRIDKAEEKNKRETLKN